MNILVLCLSPGFGGLELYAYREFLQMQAKGHACKMVVHDEGILASRLQSEKVPHIVLKRKISFLPLLAARRLARMLDDNQIDIMHIHWGRDLALAVLARKFARRDVNIIYSRHMRLTRNKDDFYHRFLYRNIDRMVVISSQLLSEAQQFIPMPNERISLLYYGVPEPASTNTESCDNFWHERSIKRNRFMVGLFGRMEHEKGQHLLVDAIAKLIADGMDIGAVIVGHVMDEDYSHKLKQKIKDTNTGSQVHLFPFMENPQQYMPCFDAVVLSTYCETFGLVLIEAMRSGTAVIGTNAGGVPEIIQSGESGLLFESGDADGLADGMRQLYQDASFKEKLARNGKKRADAMFDEEQHFLQLEKMLLAL